MSRKTDPAGGAGKAGESVKTDKSAGSTRSTAEDIRKSLARAYANPDVEIDWLATAMLTDRF
ncbi:MAG: hypothetical protein LBT40_08015 [Deltaproteobacteria bacterium]|nr:hypothetical protein [Deltaproteobacteria bacterium]